MIQILSSIISSNPYWNRGPDVWKDVISSREKLLWTGRPHVGLEVTFWTMFGFAWTIAGLVAVWFLLVWYGQISGRDGLLHWAGVVAIGSLGTLISILPTLVIFLDIIYRHMLYYAVTEERVLILDVRGGLPFSLTGYPIALDMTLKLRKGRYCTLWFEDQYKTGGTSVEVSYNSARPKAFRLARDCAKVRDLILDLAEEKRASTCEEKMPSPVERRN